MIANAYDAFLFDLDGVLYRGSDPVPHAASAVARLRASGKRIAFVTNNSARTPAKVAERLRSVGVEADEAEVETSALATASVLAGRGVRVHTVSPGPVETAGFPQRDLLSRRLGSRVVLRPDTIAETIVRAVERDRAEVVVPRYLRVAGAIQALAPGTLARLSTRVRGRA